MIPIWKQHRYGNSDGSRFSTCVDYQFWSCLKTKSFFYRGYLPEIISIALGHGLTKLSHKDLQLCCFTKWRHMILIVGGVGRELSNQCGEGIRDVTSVNVRSLPLWQGNKYTGLLHISAAVYNSLTFRSSNCVLMWECMSCWNSSTNTNCLVSQSLSQFPWNFTTYHARSLFPEQIPDGFQCVSSDSVLTSAFKSLGPVYRF